MRIVTPRPEDMPTPRLWLRVGVDLALLLLGLSLLANSWRTSALPLAIIALLLAVPTGVDAASSLIALVRRAR